MRTKLLQWHRRVILNIEMFGGDLFHHDIDLAAVQIVGERKDVLAYRRVRHFADQRDRFESILHARI